MFPLSHKSLIKHGDNFTLTLLIYVQRSVWLSLSDKWAERFESLAVAGKSELHFGSDCSERWNVCGMLRQ